MKNPHNLLLVISALALMACDSHSSSTTVKAPVQRVKIYSGSEVVAVWEGTGTLTVTKSGYLSPRLLNEKITITGPVTLKAE